MRAEDGFQQTPYTEPNAYTADSALPGLLKRLLPPAVHAAVEGDLVRFGGEGLAELRALSARAGEPRLTQYDHWGARVDDLRTSEGWRGLKAAMQREGVPAIFYERAYGEHSRVYGFVKHMLASGSSSVIFCPLAMTDGVARVLELTGSAAAKRDILPRLISRDPDMAFTAGQWMTERPGGSDISQTETVAHPVADATSPYGPVHSIDGFKWFSSATDSDVAVALARTGSVESGARGLSLFLVPLRRPLIRPVGTPRPPALTNNIRIHRLKDKVGTKVVPTAELELAGAEGYRLGAAGDGVRLIAPVLNITRMHSAVTSLGSLRRCLAIATAYSRVRTIGGRQLLCENALHVAELAKANVLYRALTHLTFGAVLLLGKTECGVATPQEADRLRLMTPAVKAFASDRASYVMEECMSLMGGQGYMEETGFGTIIKDAWVEKIWEGTVTVLALDMIRAASKPGVVDSFASWADSIMTSCPAALVRQLTVPLALLRTGLDETRSTYTTRPAPLAARPALMLYAHVTSALYLLEHAVWAHATGEPSAETDVEVFRRWVEECGLEQALQDLARAKAAGAGRPKTDQEIVYGAGVEEEDVKAQPNLVGDGRRVSAHL
ncbi:acyl-CoA dehydrogenase-like protein [Phanerochaete sordida]|uniref:Acyl-CoA dehydrogenase-like protein n=1 Tax=Phanerochaete sordida TaxID=48140 RepID=A0A9P3LLG5_9APHY|nr:acyl-CoA dehydrogenase-like protein [Phanerochaete sordida]